MTIQEFFAKPKTRAEVANFFKCSDRLARRKIAELQRDYNIVNMQDGKGYYIVPDGEPLKQYALQEYKRACELMTKANRLMKRARVDDAQIRWVDDYEAH